MRIAALAATIAVAGLVLAPGAPIAARDWEGPAAFALRVTDDHGDPISGAEVRAQASGTDVTGGPEAVLTDQLGQAVVGGLAEGEWFVEVSHPAYMLYAAYLELEAGKKPQVGFSSQVNTETSWKPMTVKFFKASAELRRGATTREQPAAEPPEVVRDVPPPSTAEQPEPPEVVRPTERERPETGETPEAPEEEMRPEEETAPEVRKEAVPPRATESEAPEGTTTEPAETSTTAPAPLTETSERAEPEAATPSEEPMPAAAPSEETTPAAPTEEPTPTGVPSETRTRLEAPAETPTPAPAPSGTPTPTTAPEEPAPAAAMAAMPRYLRSAAAGNCPECEPGEWAVASEQEAGRAGEQRSEQQCSAEFVDGAARAARLLADSTAPRLESWAGPVLPAMWRLERERRDEVEDLLVPRTDPASHCQMAGIVLPAGAQFAGYVLEAWDELGGRGCRVGFDCAVGQSRWLGEPVVVEGSARTVVYGIFKNRSTRRERRARMTVYFEPPSQDWRPAAR